MSVNTIGGVNRGNTINNPSYVVASNVVGKFRDAFETFNTASRWNIIQTGSGDVVIVDGNAAAASYLSVSKSPWFTGSQYIIESQNIFTLPVEVAVGAQLSQRTLGQEFSIELVSTDTPLPAPTNIPIASISQTTTVLTVTTQTVHNLVPGRRIGIRDIPGTSSINYPSLVVATIPTSNSFTVTAGPGGAIPSLTTVAVTNTGSVYFRSALGNSQDGTSMIFENATVTNASFYVRSEAGDVNPMGVTNANLNANHSLTIGTTAPIQAINAANTYAFFPTNEYRLMAQSDRVQWVDSPIDVQTAPISRAFRNQISPSPDKEYKLRIRAMNNDSLTVPIGQIVSASKTGTTTATVLMDRPHNLRVGEFINAYGVRAFAAAEFPTLTAATAVLSIVDANTFTVTWGTALTITSFGGYVAKVQGGNLMSSLGAILQGVQTAALTSTGILTLVSNVTWTGAVIGDYVEVIGVRDNTTGASLNVDGAWRVRNLATTALELEPLPGTTVPAAFVTTNAGGALIKRTDLRLSYIRIFDFERQRIESVNRPASDIASSLPVTVNNVPAVTVNSGTVTTVTTVGTVTTAATLTNQTQAGGIALQDQVPALMRAAAQNVRRNISVS